MVARPLVFMGLLIDFYAYYNGFEVVSDDHIGSRLYHEHDALCTLVMSDAMNGFFSHVCCMDWLQR